MSQSQEEGLEQGMDELAVVIDVEAEGGHEEYAHEKDEVVHA